MNDVAHTLPFLIRDHGDIKMADSCLVSLAGSCPGGLLVIYNQGIMTNAELTSFLQKFNLRTQIIGNGLNAGIAYGRSTCFNYIWSHYPAVKYISEIHVDMVFPSGWLEGLVNFMERHPEEPMVCPGILTSKGELHPEAKEKAVIGSVPVNNVQGLINLLPNLTFDGIKEGFVHPVLHRAEVLKAAGGYDTRFLKGKQGYEDDSLLIGYRYYQGLKTNWRPKCYLKVRVYHATLAQRTTLPDRDLSFKANLRGLIYQYGVKGLMELSNVYQENEQFATIADQLLSELDAGKTL